VTQADGTTKIVTPEMLDRTRAADVALRFMAMKNKIDPPPQGGEFNADLEDYHNERDGSRGGDASAGEDGTAPRHTSH
jgi:hypothetical protein